MTEPEGVTVGFAGLGRMGTPMARRVLDAGFPLTVWNRSPERLGRLTSLGASAADTPRALAETSEIVITMVADADALGAVVRGDEGVLAGLGPDSILIDMSTIGPKAALELAAAVRERGAHWIDSPVSGSTTLAEKGELTLMMGGERGAIERAEPVLAALSHRRFHLGGAGVGAAMKLAVNAVIAVINGPSPRGSCLPSEPESHARRHTTSSRAAQRLRRTSCTSEMRSFGPTRPPSRSPSSSCERT